MQRRKKNKSTTIPRLVQLLSLLYIIIMHKHTNIGIVLTRTYWDSLNIYIYAYTYKIHTTILNYFEVLSFGVVVVQLPVVHWHPERFVTMPSICNDNDCCSAIDDHINTARSPCRCFGRRRFVSIYTGPGNQLDSTRQHRVSSHQPATQHTRGPELPSCTAAGCSPANTHEIVN